MRKILIITYLLTTSIATAQDINGWSLDFAFGTQTVATKEAPPVGNFNANIEARRMLSNKLGFYTRGSYDVMRAELNIPDWYFYDTWSLHGGLAVNTGRLLKFETFIPKITIINKIGSGVTYFNRRDGIDTSVTGDRTDFTIAIGISLLYKINEYVAIKIDHTYLNQFSGNVKHMNQFSVGAVCYIGFGKKHRDWNLNEH